MDLSFDFVPNCQVFRMIFEVAHRSGKSIKIYDAYETTGRTDGQRMTTTLGRMTGRTDGQRAEL